jgi:hypothetical protein
MASSEYACPYVLERTGINLNDISAFLFAGEINPTSMWELLVATKKKIGSSNHLVVGMRENLAHLLIASYVRAMSCVCHMHLSLDNKETILHD